MRHFINLDLHAGGIVALDAPALGTHISCAEERDSAVALAGDDAVIDFPPCERRVDGDVEGGGGILVFAVEVASFGRLADAVEAVDFEARGEREAGFEGVDPFFRVVGIVLDFGAGVGDAGGIVIEDLGFVPCIAVFEQVIEAFFYC